MSLHKNHLIDSMTGLQNFISFFNADFESVYGNYGTLLMFRPKPLWAINEKCGRKTGDDLLKAIGAYLNEKVDEKCYRHDSGGFLIVYKEQDDYRAKKHLVELDQIIQSFTSKLGIHDVKLFKIILTYDKPLKSIADYYHLLCDVYAKGSNLEDKEMFHKVLEDISFRIKDLIEKYESANTSAFYDDISGLENHRAAMQYFNSIKMNRKSDNDIYVLFIDGDELKRFNNISYSVGNDMIMKLASTLQNTLRSSDRIFRWLSGDEFVVVLENTNHSNAALMAERLRETVENTLIDLEYPVTVSIGISKYNEDSSVDEVINQAERANKYAKDNGKNMVVFWDDVK